MTGCNQNLEMGSATRLAVWVIGTGQPPVEERSTLVQWWEQGPLMGERQKALGAKGAKASFMSKLKRESCFLGPFCGLCSLVAFSHVTSLRFYILLPGLNFIICILQVKTGSERLSPFPKVTDTFLGRRNRTWTLDYLSQDEVFAKNKDSDYNNEVFLGVVMLEENGKYKNVCCKHDVLVPRTFTSLNEEQTVVQNNSF